MFVLCIAILAAILFLVVFTRPRIEPFRPIVGFYPPIDQRADSMKVERPAARWLKSTSMRLFRTQHRV